KMTLFFLSVILVALVVVPLTTVRPVVAADASLLALQEPDGKALYSAECKKCHGVIGTPPQTMQKKYPKIASFDAKFLETHPEDSIVKVLTKGKNDDMKSFKDKMSAPEIAAVAKYVRELAARPKSGGE